MNAAGIGRLRRIADRAIRMRAFDPALNAARTAGVLRWGPNLSALVHAGALRWPTRPAVIDDDGTITYRELDRQAEKLANVVRDQAEGPVGVLARNHRGFVLAQLALERAGRDYVLLNTALAAADLAAIVQREKLAAVLADDESADQMARAQLGVAVLSPDMHSVDAKADRSFCPPPRRKSRVIMLTSGTTGPPKGARSASSNPSLSDAALLDALPLQVNDVTMITSPLFHAWGLAQAAIALGTGSTMVLHKRFEPRPTIAALLEHRVTTLAVVPVILGRILDAAPPSLELPDLRVVLCSGNVLSATLATAWMDRFGYNLYNVYGSTETAIASVATPHDMVNAPGTVGTPPAGVTVAILDDDNEVVPAGRLGRVFTANSMQFDGYTDGTSRARHGRLMATGDLGYLDSVGRLFVDGRENDLIVSGGENVFPSRVEEVLEQHPQVLHAAVVGQSDSEFGQRVVGFLVADEKLDPAALYEWCRERLAPFERPRSLHIVDELPMTATGKVLRRTLADTSLPSSSPTP